MDVVADSWRIDAIYMNLNTIIFKLLLLSMPSITSSIITELKSLLRKKVKKTEEATVEVEVEDEKAQTEGRKKEKQESVNF